MIFFFFWQLLLPDRIQATGIFILLLFSFSSLFFFFTFAYGSFCFRKVLELEGKTCIASRVYPTVAAFIDPHLYAFNNGTETITVDKLNVWSTNKPVKMNSWKVMCNLKHNFIRSSDITEIFKSRLKKQKKKIHTKTIAVESISWSYKLILFSIAVTSTIIIINY